MTYNVFDVVKDTITGNAEYVPPEVKQYRLSVCTACSYFKPISRQCGICGCFVDVKVIYAPSECAHNPPKWNSI
jgi:hypothetical protein